MTNKKIKVFAAAYLNKTNAQNLSIRSLAENIDKSRFELYTCSIHNGDLDIPEIDGVSIFRCFYPFKISGRLAYIWGIWKADVVYFPRGEFSDFGIFLVKLFGKKSFKTVRNKLDDAALKSAVSIYKDTEQMVRAYTKHNKVFSTTSHMRDYNFNRFGIKTEPQTLFVTSDTSRFSVPGRQVEKLSQLVFIGNDMFRKGIDDYISLASQFPELIFNVIGSANAELVERFEQQKNIKYHGVLKQDDMLNILLNVQLHIFPSRSEGLGKVTIECAAAGIPTITYADYGPDEWIDHEVEGYVVNKLDEIKNTITNLLQSPEVLKKVSGNTHNLAERFDIGKLTRKYEQVIEDIYHDR